MKLHHYLIPLLGLACAQTTVVRGIEIKFEATEGYSISGGTPFSNGNLGGQPFKAGATKWYSSTTPGTDMVRVVKDARGQYLQTFDTQHEGGAFFRFLPSGDDLGDVFDPESSVLAYSFNLRIDDEPFPHTRDTGVLVRPRFGEDTSGHPVTAFEFLDSGRFNYSDETKTIAAVAKDGTTFYAKKGVMFTVSGQIDYAANTYTLFVNGVQQKTDAGSLAIPFKSTEGKTPNFSLRDLSDTGNKFRRVSFDDLKLELVRARK
ncbi:MAG: hypothetical protein WC205_17475 [Opitutaceae bacterium]|jgi:hypothetical protein